MELSHKYSSILRKCALFNAAILMGTMISVPAMADGYTPVTERLVVAADGTETLDSRSFTELGGDTIDSGAAIRNLGTVTVTDSYFDGNYITKPKSNNAGGAIYNGSGATLTVSGTEFVGNNIQNTTTNTSLGGAIYNLGGTMAITDSKFIGNHVDGLKPRGGAIHNTGNMTLSGSVFQKNETINTNGTLDMMASAVYQSSGTSTVTNNLFGGDTFEDGNVGNSVFVNNSGTVYFEGNTFKNNTVAKEAVVHSQGATTKTYFDGTNTFESNKGGAIYNWASATTTFNSDSTTNFVNNNAAWNPEQSGSTLNGGAIYNNNTMTFEAGSTANFTGNNAKEGGAIYNEGTLTLNGTATFSGNTANGVANDIHNAGTLNVGGDLTLDGGITGDGNITFAEGASLTASLQTTTILANSVTFEGNNKLNLTVANGLADADYDFITADVTGADKVTIADNAIYNLKLTDAGKINVSVKSGSEIIDELDIPVTAEEANAMSAVIASNGNGTETANAIADAISTAMQNGNAAAAVKAVKDLAPTTLQQVLGVTQSVNNLLSNVTGTRMAALGRAGGDAFVGGALWAQGLYNHTKQDSSASSDGFDADTAGIAFGIDGKVNEAVTIGIGYGYTKTDADSNGRDVDVDGHNIFVYGQYQPSAWYINTMLSYGLNKYEEKKSPMGIAMKAKYDVNTYAANLMTGYNFSTGITPEGGLRYVLADQKSYNDGAQRISTDKNDVLTAVLGVKYTTNLKAKDWTFKPALRVAATYDVVSDNSKANVNVIGGSNYQITGERLHRFGVETGVGVTSTVKDWDLTLEYNGGFRKDYQSHTGLLKAKYRF